ncbi:MAG: N-acetylmuramoyl-L-alanine amidase, partial [Candidatus Edwardsbacteria bacterium]|nr:N-acetylmuramoyl-L-alanine amidase [Candidatus Edwardsbacteria bacterium]
MAPGTTQAQPKLDVVYPAEGQKIPAVSASFIYGSVTPGSQVWVNTQSVEVYETGAWLAFVPFQEGEFTLRVYAHNEEGSASLERKVVVAQKRTLIKADSFGIIHTSIFPDAEKSLLPGDRLFVSFRGTPGCKASFSIGHRTGQPMTESGARVEQDSRQIIFTDKGPDTVTVPGRYSGSYTVGRDDRFVRERVFCYLVDHDGNLAFDSSDVLVSDWPESLQVVARIKDTLAIFKTAPELGYELFLPLGIKLELNGADGEYVRVPLCRSKEAWVKRSQLELLPPGTALQPSKVDVIRAIDVNSFTGIRIVLSRAVPYNIAVSDDCKSLTILLFNAQADIDWIRYAAKNRMVGNIQWKQPETDLVQLTVSLNKPLWGWRAEYQDNVLLVTVRPRPAIDSDHPLRGLKIALDPGHSPDNGAVGPLRTVEKDVNWQVAKKLGERLEDAGATVIFTRKENEGAKLYERPRKAAEARADLLVSLHNNSHPDGVNPLKDSGFSTYYYQPFSRDLAWEVHQIFQKTLPLPDHGFYYGNLVLCRTTEMPSFLVEPTFIIVPKEEALIRDPDFQEKIALALL